MPFVTRLVLTSGDRGALDGVVEELRRAAERKGVDLRGPHTAPPDTYSVPLLKRPAGDDGRHYSTWSYTVYERTLEFTGHDETVRSLVSMDVPRGVRRTVEVSQVRSAGG
ncbi:MAG: 30S ribosomal protein S10 [Halobacteriales archaeon]